MDNLIDELIEINDDLLSNLDQANNSDPIKTLILLEEEAINVGKSWSGSWIGYQSRVYYKDFALAPAGDNFSSEWGLFTLRDKAQNNWKEYEYNYVIDYIKQKAGIPDLSKSIEIGNRSEKLFNIKKSSLISILETYLQHRLSSYLESFIDKYKNFNIPTGSSWLKTQVPDSVWSRDSLAMSQGVNTPPHLKIISEIFNIRSQNFACDLLSEDITAIISHIERQHKQERKMKRIGTNVFIGHGHSSLWRELKDFIQDRLNLPWDEFNRVPVAGVTNISRLSEMLNSATIAFLILTAEDELVDGKHIARMNVIHEAGLFQGRLGFLRAIVLLEEDCEEFSNISGLGQIRFPKGNIAASFEEIRRVLEREEIINK